MNWQDMVSFRERVSIKIKRSYIISLTIFKMLRTLDVTGLHAVGRLIHQTVGIQNFSLLSKLTGTR